MAAAAADLRPVPVNVTDASIFAMRNMAGSRRSRRSRLVFWDRDFTHGCDGARAPLEPGPEKFVERVDVVRLHDEEQRMLGVRAVSANQFEAFDIGVEQGVGSPFVLGTGFGGMLLRDMEEHRRLQGSLEVGNGTRCRQYAHSR